MPAAPVVDRLAAPIIFPRAAERRGIGTEVTQVDELIRADDVDPRGHRGMDQGSTDPQIGRTTVNENGQRWSLVNLSGVRNGAGRAMRQ